MDIVTGPRVAPVPSPPDVTVPIVTSEESAVTAVFTSVPLVGSVTDVAAVTVNVVPKFPEIVMVDAALFATPVPPRVGAMIEVGLYEN